MSVAIDITPVIHVIFLKLCYLGLLRKLIVVSWPNRQLVSSYKGKFGYVQYFVKAVLERPSQPTQECKKHFEVEEPLDVNTPDLLVSLNS